MYSQIITHVGNGAVANYDLKFDACAAWIIPSNAAHIGYHHPTMWTARSNAMGARWSGSAYSNNSRMMIVGARVYNRALSDAELIARHERARLGSVSAADVTSGLVASWDGDGLSGNTWTDAAGANHGTITGGTIVSL